MARPLQGVLVADVVSGRHAGERMPEGVELVLVGVRNQHRLHSRLSDMSGRRSLTAPPPSGCFPEGRAVNSRSYCRGSLSRIFRSWGSIGTCLIRLLLVDPDAPPRRMTTKPFLPRSNKRSDHRSSVAVGTRVSPGPPLRSVRAALPHTAPTLDDGGTPLLRPGVQDAGTGEPPVDELRHAVPVDAGPLAASPQGFVPHPGDLGTKGPDRFPVAR